MEEKVQIQEAENLVLKEVKGYYESKVRECDSKMQVNYELKDQKQPIFVRRPKNRNINVRPIKTQICEDLDGFDGSEAYEIKHLQTSKRGASYQNIEKDMEKSFKKTAKNYRTSSSMI